MKNTLVTGNTEPNHPPATIHRPPNDRAAINRSNSQHSTGPRTEAGKKRSALNALRHGLTGHTIVMPEEDLAAYQCRTQRFFDELKPKGTIEEQLVQTLADTAWRLNRIPALEANLLSLGMDAQSESVDTGHPQVHAALATAQSLEDHIRTMSLLSMHDHRLTRKFETTLKQLTERQAVRRAQETYASLQKPHRDQKPHPGDAPPPAPDVDGFVFTNRETATPIEPKQHLKEVRETVPPPLHAS